LDLQQRKHRCPFIIVVVAQPFLGMVHAPPRRLIAKKLLPTAESFDSTFYGARPVMSTFGHVKRKARDIIIT
jgi:hypothetical protein